MNELCDQIDDFIDSQLDDGETATFEKHLDSCAVCQRVLQETNSFERELVEAWSSVLAPRSILDSVSVLTSPGNNSLGDRKSELSGSRRLAKPSVGWKHVVAAVASVALLAAFVLLLRFNGATESDQHASAIQEAQSKDISPRLDAQNAGDTVGQPAIAVESPNFDLKVTSTMDVSDESPAILLAKTEDDFTIVEVYPIYEQTNKPEQQ